jgi:predicted phage tail protein
MTMPRTSHDSSIQAPLAAGRFGVYGAGGDGGKGGGGSSSAPTEADDSLQSVQYGTIVDLISEGEIQGLDNGLQSLYLDSTPLLSPSGGENFTGYTTQFRTGTQAQAYIPTNGTESEKAVNVEFTNPTPVVRSITDSDIDRVRVTVQLPALQIIEDDGDIIGHTVDIRIQVQYNGAGYTTIVDDTISGKTTNTYQRDYLIPLTGAFPVDIKLVRVSADETSARRQNRTYWFSYTEIIDEKLRYPNSALAYLRFDSRQFNNIPQRKYLIRGIKVRLPSNATVDTTTHLGRVTYSGVWDGTFGAATWCADPAWCLYDLLTNTRYGASIPETSLDRYDFYAISQYCNELVSNGFGALEPRFACNVYVNTREEVYNLIQEFVSIFRGIAYYGAGSMAILADRPSGDPDYILGPSNVIDGNFSYSGSGQKARHTTATVSYQSYETLGEVEFEYVEDADAVSKYGIINKDMKAFGCYSRGQAHRLGKWALLTEQNLTDTVSFGVSIDSNIVLRPGKVVGIADPVKSGARRSGRISSATTTAITVDSTSGLPTTTANSPTLSVLLATGLVETRTISTIAGNVFTVGTPFSAAPAAGSVFLIETTDIEAQLFRVLTVAEGEGGSYAVTALAYNESLYAAIESDLSLEFRDVTNLSAIPEAPSSIVATEHLYVDGQSVLTAVELSWQSPVDRVAEFRIEYRLDSSNWQRLTTQSPSIRLTGLHAGNLQVQIRSVNSIGGLSPAAIAAFQLVGKTAIPGNVQNLTLEAISANSARLRWDATVDLDVKTGGKVHIRHTSLTDGSGTWTNSVDLIPAVAGHSTEAIVPLVAGEILVKFADDGGRQSAAEASVIVTVPDALGYLLVETRREDQDTPPFQGAKTDVFYDSTFDALTLEGTGLFDAEPSVDAITSFDYLGDIVDMGEYAFTSTLDLGNAFALDLQRRFVTRGILPGNLIDSRTDLIDDWSDFDGAIADQVNAKLLLRSTSDNPSGTPTWSSWQEFVNGTFKGRAFQFKAQLESLVNWQNILVDELGYEASFQRRTEQSTATIASGAGAKAVTFDSAFYDKGGTVLPSIGITAQNMATGDYFTLSSISRTGFTITFRNSAGTAIDRNFTYSAVGYGKQV